MEEIYIYTSDKLNFSIPPLLLSVQSCSPRLLGLLVKSSLELHPCASTRKGIAAVQSPYSDG